MNILFVCKHNRFRSKVAEALFRHHYKGNKVSTKSAGLAIDIMRPYVSRNVVSALKEKGVSIRDDGAIKLDSFILKWADKIIIVADNVSSDMFKDKEFIKGKQIIYWDISDTPESDIEGIKKRVSIIEKLVLDLIKMVES